MRLARAERAASSLLLRRHGPSPTQQLTALRVSTRLSTQLSGRGAVAEHGARSPSGQVVGAAGGLPAEARGGPPSRYALRWTAFGVTASEGWAHLAFTRINIAPTILHKKIE